MNARILRKWSIHTKNLMSCSACSLVVVVLLLLLLLVTCAPTLVLATMNSPPPRPHATQVRRIVDADAAAAAIATSLAVDPIQTQLKWQQHAQLQPQSHHPYYMPKNVVDVEEIAAVGPTATATSAATDAVATSSSLLLSASSSLSSVLSSPAAASSSSSSSSSASLPYRSHRLASPPRVEVAKSEVVSFPGFYTNRRLDDIQPSALLVPSHRLQQPPAPPASQIPAHTRHIVKSSTNGDGVDVDVIDTRWIFHEDKEGHKDIVAVRGPWPRPYHPSLPYTTPPPPAALSLSKDLSSVYNKNSDNNDDSQTMTSSSSSSQSSPGSKSDNSEARVRYNEGKLITFKSTKHDFPLPLQYVVRPRDDERRHHMHMAESLPSNQYQPQVAALQMPAKYLNIEDDDDDDDNTDDAITAEDNHKKPIETQFLQTDDSSQKILSTIDKKFQKYLSQDNNNKNKNFHTKDNSNVNKVRTSAAWPIRYVVEPVPIYSNKRPQLKQMLEKHPKDEQQQRLLQHHQRHVDQQQQLKQLRTMQQQAARRRRDSLRGSGSGGAYYNSNNHKRDRYESHEQQQQQQQRPQHHQQQEIFRNKHHNHRHQNHNNQRGRMRKHARRYCSARDPAQLAFEAPTVFEGKIVSVTQDRRMNFSATVLVREVFKQQIGYRVPQYLRLNFTYHNTSGECDIYREQLRPRGLVKGDTIEPSRMYLMFVQQIDNTNFTILGQPIRKTKRVVEAVRNAVSENYAQLASIKSLKASNTTVEIGQELRIVCKVNGRPPPKVTWFKDHRSINRNRKLYQFTHYKKRSELYIRSFNYSDAGRYECRAKNKVNQKIERRALVIKAQPEQRFDPNPRGNGFICPDDASEFCLNGGTCKFFSEINSFWCICPDGFAGERCERKEVNKTSTYSNEQECAEKKYFGYYC